MQQYSKDCEISFNLAMDNARKRIKLLNEADKNCVLEEYNEWIRDGLSKNSVLFLRDDPII